MAEWWRTAADVSAAVLYALLPGLHAILRIAPHLVDYGMQCNAAAVSSPASVASVPVTT